MCGELHTKLCIMFVTDPFAFNTMLSSQQYKAQLYECQQRPQFHSSTHEMTPPNGSAPSSKDASPTLKRKMATGGEGPKGVEGKELSKRIGQLTSKGLFCVTKCVFETSFYDDVQNNVGISDCFVIKQSYMSYR